MAGSSPAQPGLRHGEPPRVLNRCSAARRQWRRERATRGDDAAGRRRLPAPNRGPGAARGASDRRPRRRPAAGNRGLERAGTGPLVADEADRLQIRPTRAPTRVSRSRRSTARSSRPRPPASRCRSIWPSGRPAGPCAGRPARRCGIASARSARVRELRPRGRRSVFGHVHGPWARHRQGAAGRAAVDDLEQPNYPYFLEPQWKKTRNGYRPYSPHLYRPMHELAYNELKAVTPANDVLIGGLAASGSPRGGRGGVQPLEFLRTLACVNKTLAPLKVPGVQGRGRSCTPTASRCTRTPSVGPPASTPRAGTTSISPTSTGSACCSPSSTTRAARTASGRST